MNPIEERHDDKSKWDRGEWDAEPDKIEWRDEATGLPCLIVRGPSGALCGCVAVSEGHAAFKKDYDDVDVRVHGGLTYADHCAEDGHICHVPQPGEPENVWWLGFDCAHSGDYCPGSSKYRAGSSADLFARKGWETYRTVAYVRSQVTQLAHQLANGTTDNDE